MSDAKGNQEPSMEEILASIRRIISEDGEPKEEAAPPAVNGHAPVEEDGEDDALVLTDMVVGDSNVVELKEEVPVKAPEQEPKPQPQPEPDPVPSAVPVAVAPVPEPEVPQLEIEEIRAEPPVAALAEIAAEGPLVSPDVEAASTATMAQLMARKAALPQQRAPASIDGLLVETLVRQAVEPMLREWLDEHLQDIVERLVRREVERLSRKAELS